jgi:hypothetical protein
MLPDNFPVGYHSHVFSFHNTVLSCKFVRSFHRIFSPVTLTAYAIGAAVSVTGEFASPSQSDQKIISLKFSNTKMVSQKSVCCNRKINLI